MRLGEIKQKLDEVISTKGILSIQNEPLYAEQAQKVLNYGDLLDALEIIARFDWNDLSKDQLQTIISKYPKESVAIMELADFNTFSAYIGKINEKLPLFYSILEDMVDEQDEQIINVKLPKKLVSLEELSQFNGRINTLFKSFQIDGEIKFCDFDKGSSWYEILVTGYFAYRYFLACLKVAQEYLKAEKEYFSSKEAEISYQTAKLALENLQKKSLREDKAIDVLSLEEYKENWLTNFIRENIKTLVEEEIKELNGGTSEEIQTRFVVATTALVKELGEGTEFHLSLNPPEYAKEQAGKLVIDYKKLRTVAEIEQGQQAQILAPKESDAATV